MAAPLRGGDLSRLRQLNALAAVGTLRSAGPLTLSALAERTGLSRPSTKEVVDELMRLGWVEETPPAQGTIGRPARRYRFRATSGHLVGLDIGGHNIRAALSDLNGEILAETRQPVQPDTPLDERLAAIERTVASCLALAGKTIDDVWIVAAGTIGVVTPEGRIRYCAAIPAWTGLDLAGHLRGMFPCEVLVENDSRLAAKSEAVRGAVRDASDVVFLHVGRRMGAAVIIGGKVHRGFGAAAGEIAMLPQAQLFDASEHLQNCPVIPEDTSPADAAGYTLAAARAGDPVALAAVERYVDDLAVGTSAMVLLLDPQVVVLGGGFSRSADVLLPRLRERLERACIRPPELRASTLGDECVVTGAIDYAVAHIDDRHFTPDVPLPTSR
ncbi:ROK family transcriptional regulator [Nonomuraea mesophila]|uniref:ROK family transcriptional regulator n=1 Tax=Nonomuraea mesophila TaxID=2530382 RepID=A0A4R5FS82_9ACTN|nr:ROK family transcriptional regulator [Nonomuraea mesophila]TDE56077.1 ROK family transcriptional regulator [Nonomuraea mesophila]